jgi:hypothetical protein
VMYTPCTPSLLPDSSVCCMLFAWSSLPLACFTVSQICLSVLNFSPLPHSALGEHSYSSAPLGLSLSISSQLLQTPDSGCLPVPTHQYPSSPRYGKGLWPGHILSYDICFSPTNDSIFGGKRRVLTGLQENGTDAIRGMA